MGKTTQSTEKREGFCGGKGTAELLHWIAEEEKCPHLRKAATLVLPCGATMGSHRHEGEAELYLVWQGSGRYDDNGVSVAVGPGSVMICRSGQSHALENTGEVPLVIHEVIITET
ncbi:MAG: cupin domain-containing protein [Christensenella sp.]|nr:cupin domain-containing protein [Christensenella sp.]